MVFLFHQLNPSPNIAMMYLQDLLSHKFSKSLVSCLTVTTTKLNQLACVVNSSTLFLLISRQSLTESINFDGCPCNLFFLHQTRAGLLILFGHHQLPNCIVYQMDLHWIKLPLGLNTLCIIYSTIVHILFFFFFWYF